jgi:hypothetical protein
MQIPVQLSTTSIMVPPGIETTTSPGSIETTGVVHLKIHLASSGLALIQPCDLGVP